MCSLQWFAELILQVFRHFTYVTALSPTIPSLHLRNSSFFNPFFRFSYVTGTSLTSPGEPPKLLMSKYVLTVPGKLGRELEEQLTVAVKEDVYFESITIAIEDYTSAVRS